MNAIKSTFVIVLCLGLCLGLSSGARYFLTGTYAPDWARVVTPYPPAPAFDLNTVQSTIGQPSDLTPINATIFQLSLRDVPQQDLCPRSRVRKVSARPSCTSCPSSKGMNRAAIIWT